MNCSNAGIVNRIFNLDAVSGVRRLPDEFVPLTVTSPPYDALRHYGGHEFTREVFEELARELWRVTCPGGVIAWVVADQISGGYSGTSFRQALHFMDVGFRLHDLLIMTRMGHRNVGPRYGKVEFAFVLSKGKPRSIDLIRDKANKHAGKRFPFKVRLKGGLLRVGLRKLPVAKLGLRGPVWEYSAGYLTTTPDRYVLSSHPAVMPEAMAEDLITSWSRPGDLILDPMMGSATTCKMALLNHRRYLGFEIHEPYFRLAERRMRDAHHEYDRRLGDWLLGA